MNDLFAALRRGEVYNEGDYGGASTMTAIMGRMSAYIDTISLDYCLLLPGSPFEAVQRIDQSA